MSDNIIHHSAGVAILNGGDPLPGCPENWDEARKWQDSVNKANEENEDYDGPMWVFDCGFKLDFDGPILRISSRFYPPKTHYGSTWDGTVHVRIFDKEVESKKFDCATLDELKIKVEEYVNEIKNRISNIFPDKKSE